MDNLKSTVNFPMRIFNGSSTAIDNIFYCFIKKFYYKSPHQWVFRAQCSELLTYENVTALIQEFTSHYARNINSFIVDEFQSKLSTESWEDIFEGSDTNVIFNNLSNIYLKTFYTCFTKSKLNSTLRYNPQITRGSKESYCSITILYMSYRENNDTNLKLIHKIYCKILINVIKTAKKVLR